MLSFALSSEELIKLLVVNCDLQPSSPLSSSPPVNLLLQTLPLHLPASKDICCLPPHSLPKISCSSSQFLPYLLLLLPNSHENPLHFLFLNPTKKSSLLLQSSRRSQPLSAISHFEKLPYPLSFPPVFSVEVKRMYERITADWISPLQDNI